MSSRLKPVPGSLNRLSIGPGAGEIFDSFVGAVAPRSQPVERELCRRSAIGLEAEIPGTLYRRNRAVGELWQSPRRRFRGITEDDEDRSPGVRMQRRGRSPVSDPKGCGLDCASIWMPNLCFLSGR